MGKIAIVVCALAALGCGVAPVQQSDSGTPGDAWVLPPIEYETCPAQCVPTCGPRSSDCEHEDPVCQGCVARCWMTAHPETFEPELATCHSTPEPACRAGSAECMRRR